jgi:MerR family transcriptional regulator, heat shock protein HspR
MVDYDKDLPVYMISVAAELAGVHPQTLRAYEQRGLVVPKRTSGNTRRYSISDIEKLSLINELTDEGINLAGVVRILDLKERLDARTKEVDDLHARVRRLADRVHELETYKDVHRIMKSETKSLTLKRNGGLLHEVLEQLDEI